MTFQKVSITPNPVKHRHQLLTELVWVLIIDLQLKTILIILISNR